MTTRWAKLGLLYEPRALHEKLVSHAANPLAIHLYDDIFRIFFSGRDAQNRSSVGYVDADIVDRRVVEVGTQPVFEHGPEGSFYSHGVSIGNYYKAAGRRYILFMGWHVPVGGHWRGEIGRLVVGDALAFSLEPKGPFIPLSPEDPVSLSYPWVMKDPRGGYHMWYGSTETWDAGNGEMVHVIKHAHSNDGERWQTDNHTVPNAIGVAQAFSRPTVVAEEDGYRMWFSYRSGSGQTYRIGEAVSRDAHTWQLLLDPAGIDVSDDGWDSEMIAYPFVFAHRGTLYMLYNGNDFGRTGIGLAVAERAALG